MMKCVVIIHLITKTATVRGRTIRAEEGGGGGGGVALPFFSQIVAQMSEHMIVIFGRFQNLVKPHEKGEIKQYTAKGFKKLPTHANKMQVFM